MRNLLAAMIVATAILAAPVAAQEKAAGAGEPNTVAARAELYRLINQVRTMKFADQAAGATEKQKPAGKRDSFLGEPNSAQMPAGEAEAKAEAASATVKTEPQAKPAKEAAPLVQDPNMVTNPFELAESLYRVGRFKEAAACYRAALARSGVDKRHKVSESDQAWMLFQVGNCFVKTNPTEAIKAYRQLITDFPSSEWTPIAVGREQIVQWYADSRITPKAEKPTVEKQQ
jgi:tetratricopeptide (TPR) repeat protein